MDPLSLSLATISFVTALKDLIKTIQVIRDSISKYPQNYRNAKRLAAGVLKTLLGMEEIYKEHEQALNESKYLRKAINDLHTEMELAHEEFARLAPPVSEKKVERIKLAFYSFWNRQKIERLLSELRDHVNLCSHDFQLLSSVRTEAHVIRTEAHIVEMHNNMVQSTARGTVGVYRPSNVGSTTMLHSGLGIVTNPHFFSFIQSTPMPMTWIPDTIPVHDLSKAYLRREVRRTAHSFESVLVRWSHNPQPQVAPVFSPTWALEELSQSGITLHQNAVVLAFGVQSLLLDSQSASWAENVHLAANKLAINLWQLEMHEDATMIWTSLVGFQRVIATVYPSRTYSRYLSAGLVNLALGFWNLGNLSEARSKTNEALESFRLLAVHEPMDRLKKLDIAMIARIMILQESFKPNSTRSLQKAIDASRMLEDTFGLTELHSGMPDLSSSTTISPRNWAVLMSRNQEVSDDNWYAYTSNLLHIAEVHNQPLEAHKFAQLALMIFNHLFAKYPASDRIQSGLSRALIFLLNMIEDTTDSQAATEKLEYLQQYILICRQQALVDPQRYVLHLAHALWMQRRVFLDLGRSDEADNTYQDLIDLKDLAAAPPHPDLHIPSEIEAKYYAQLAQYHYNSERFTDAMYASQNAISQFSALEFMDPGRSRRDHIDALAWLCKSLNAARQHNTTVSEGFKAIEMIDNSNMKDSVLDTIECDVLCEMMEALEASSHSGALAQAAEINARVKKLACSGKVEDKFRLALALVKYAMLLCKNQTTEDATEAFEDIYDNWGILYRESKDPINAALEYIKCAKSLLNLFKQQGDIERALHYNEVARAIIKNLARGASNDLSRPLHFLDIYRISLLCSAGRYPEALELSRLMVSNIRNNSHIDDLADIDITTRAFYWLAQTQLYNCMPNNAIDTTTEALSLSQTTSPKGNSQNLAMLSLSYDCLLLLDEGLHDVGRVNEALYHLNRAEKVTLQINSVDSMEALEATGDDSYERLLFRRSLLLFTKEDYPEAVKLIQKVEIIDKEKFNHGETTLKNLAITLFYSRIFYCTIGRHEKGLAAAHELAKLKATILPAIVRLIDIDLEYETKRGAWKSVQNAKDKLTCTHQNDF